MSCEKATIIGLEVHVQLDTQSKLFCGCSTRFGAPPNTHICPVCLGAPGALPVLNRQALDLAIQVGLALNCEIETNTKWDRKNYFYPDLPKGYQISQFDRPICANGYLDLIDPEAHFADRRVQIERAHLEEDAGKSSHDETGAGGSSKIDLNRAGTPLLEIVTRPDLRSGTEAKAFLTELKLILSNLQVSDCNMQEGSLRVDANVNLHLAEGDRTIATPIVEIKNLNSFRAVQRAIDFESERQWKQWQEDGRTIDQAAKQTRGWDDESGQTVLQRTKEDSADYRYFPEPDLAVVHTTVEQRETIGKKIGPLPSQQRAELISAYSLSAYDAGVLVQQGRRFVDFFETIARPLDDGKLVSNWLQQEVLRYLKEQQADIDQFPVSTEQFIAFLKLIQSGKLDTSRGKAVMQKMMEQRLSLEESMEQLGIAPVEDDELAAICRQVIEENPDIIQQIREGNTKAVGNLIGQAKQINRNVDPALVRKQILNFMKTG
ncbi:MAG: Asp-tRNA(Asn)/Glu-tRNA(Gln) amidotransferase subunit GatB [Mariniblastus sp.]|nr:Asp-tRNA(Asn)/Glu-tRNA(Gln) amidotransferase subunit GatB [Mariniblastus sp.]